MLEDRWSNGIISILIHIDKVRIMGHKYLFKNHIFTSSEHSGISHTFS